MGRGKGHYQTAISLCRRSTARFDGGRQSAQTAA